MILPGAEPFFLPGSAKGVLLVHGFTGLPAELLLMGKYLQEQGFTVMGIRLAGHGTTAEDMSHMTDEDWMDSVRDGYALLSGCTESVSVIGHSMGGLFALLLAAEERIDRVVSLAAPIVIAEERGIKFLPPREVSEGLFVPKARRNLKNVPPVVNHTYRKMPLISVHEMLDVIERVKHYMPEVKVPTLIVHSRKDHTAAPESAEYIYGHIGSREKEIYWRENSGHLLPLEEGREIIFEKVAAFLQKGLQKT